jgi:excisionase family DNA binding protein
MAGQHSASEPLLTPAQVAAIVFVDPKTVSRWARAGKIASTLTPGGHRRFRSSDVEALLRADDGPDQIHLAALGAPPLVATIKRGTAAVDDIARSAADAKVAEARAVALEAQADAAAEAVTERAAAVVTAAATAAVAAVQAREARALAVATAANARDVAQRTRGEILPAASLRSVAG